MPTPIPLVESHAGRPDQVGILVPTLEAAINGATSANDSWKIWTYGPATLTRTVVHNQPGSFEIRIALAGSTPQVELIEPVRGPSIYQEWIEKHGYGLHHLGFFVDDLDRAITTMMDAGYPLLQAGWGTGADGSGGFAYFDTQTTCGYLVEAIAPPQRRRTPEPPTHPSSRASDGER